ncbi:PAS domain-containing sensor histidine kinase [Shinella daejeonensis]|uniref:sensor histidine kinase n=1 Tax=Shinella daejeonensis TaxID=659017 RepID=UPI0020C7A9A4|nr:PAS domain-containing sensor histidine kinase [Shinella daejeonensis]MCP8896857.1 PAS domain-containing sensor histidine kinase [Shinella daejeonensis]
MSAKQYPFIDVAVHERVRAPFSRGDAVVLFSPDMARVLWANGRGAALFGHDNIYDFLDAGPDTANVAFRQLSATARQARRPGEARTLLMRIGAGFRSAPVQAEVECIALRPAENAILFSAPVTVGEQSPEEAAQAMLSGFDDPDTHMAVLDEDGGVIAASEGFSGLSISPETRRLLVGAAGRDADRLVKRPIPTGRGHLPAAIGRVSEAPALHLLFAVETILGHLDPDAGDAEASDDPGIEDISPAAMQADPDTSAATSISSEPVEDTIPPQPGETETAQDTPAPETLAPMDEGQDGAMAAQEPAAIASPAAFVFNRQSRPVRFVWKIDAEGRFSEISEEFPATVGPAAAAITDERFSDVAKRFDLDPDGKIGELLRRRDTWSGKTILWPVQGTSLVVPVDLAALPTYSRAREFDGFRGFGILRIADAEEDPRARGLTLGLSHEAEGEDVAADAAPPAPEPVSSPDGAEPPETSPDEAGASPAGVPDAAAQEETFSHDAFQGERPALRLVENPGRREPDKIVRLEARRERSLFEGLSSSEQAAFREIARQLGDTFGKRKPEDRPSDEDESPTGETGAETVTPPPQEPVDAVSPATSGPADEDMADDDPAAAAGRRLEPDAAPEEDAEAAPADAVDDGHGGIAPARTRMEYGLTATVVDALPVALLIHVGDQLIHANPEFLRLTGYAALSDLDTAGGLDTLFEQPAEEGRYGAGMMALHHADGHAAIPVRARLQSIRWEDGTALMLALTPAGKPAPEAEDGRKDENGEQAGNAEQIATTALRVEIGELRSILETATDGVVVVGQDGAIRSMNRSASALFNYDEDETRGRPFAMLFAHESQKAVLDYLAGLSDHGVASVLNDGREVIGREAAGGFIPLFMTMGRLSASAGYCAVIRDITQWKRTEEELRNAKRAAEMANAHKSDFLARVSHEIRTPLNAIIGFSDMMATERFGPVGHPRYIEYANDIGRSGRHVLDIVNDLLDISKIEAGEMDLDFTAVGLNETVAEAVSLVQPQANAQRVIIRTSLTNTVPKIVADQRSIKQIALNILSNAIRFTPSGGQIVVSTVYEANGSVALRIRDTGIGMTRNELEQAMKPFRQVTTGGGRKRGDGTGLGLPLTKAMVEANRASFAISSTPNEGTLIEVSFPSPRVLAD